MTIQKACKGLARNGGKLETESNEWVYHCPQYDGDIPEYIGDHYTPDEWEVEFKDNYNVYNSVAGSGSPRLQTCWNPAVYPKWFAIHSYRFRKKSSECPSALSSQEGGSHYTGRSIQPIEYIHANKLDFFEGNVVKYVTRHKSKGGAEDIRKAIHYLEMLLELNYKEGH